MSLRHYRFFKIHNYYSKRIATISSIIVFLNTQQFCSISATPERTFSTLRRIKSWMRTRMREDRLTGLALLNVHRDIEVNIEEVVNRFARKKTRKLDFVI